MSGIKDKVAIIGMGCTKFGERFDASREDLVLEAIQEALEDIPEVAQWAREMVWTGRIWARGMAICLLIL